MTIVTAMASFTVVGVQTLWCVSVLVGECLTTVRVAKSVKSASLKWVSVKLFKSKKQGNVQYVERKMTWFESLTRLELMHEKKGMLSYKKRITTAKRAILRIDPRHMWPEQTDEALKQIDELRVASDEVIDICNKELIKRFEVGE